MLSLLHTPQALVVMKLRCSRSMGSTVPGARVTSATLSSHILIWDRPVAASMTPSVARKPAARSMS